MTHAQLSESTRCLLLLVTLSTVARAAVIVTYTESTVPEGLEYNYTVANTSTELLLYDITFQFPLTPSGIALPEGWDYIQGGTDLEAFSTNVGAPPVGTDIPPNATLDGFRFIFADRVSKVPYTALLASPDNPTEPITETGAAVPVIVPEPSTLACLLGGALLMSALRPRLARHRPH